MNTIRIYYINKSEILKALIKILFKNDTSGAKSCIVSAKDWFTGTPPHIAPRSAAA